MEYSFNGGFGGGFGGGYGGEFVSGYGGGDGFDAIFTLFPLFFGVILFLIIGTTVISAVKGVGEWSKNNQSPILTVDAKIVSKRADVCHHTSSDAGDNTPLQTTTSTFYYITFEVESGDRMELSVAGREYGLLVEGDFGRLTFQGTRYKDFSRQAADAHRKSDAGSNSNATASDQATASDRATASHPTTASGQTSASNSAPSAVQPAKTQPEEPGQADIEFFFSGETTSPKVFSDNSSAAESDRLAVTWEEAQAQRQTKNNGR